MKKSIKFWLAVLHLMLIVTFSKAHIFGCPQKIVKNVLVNKYVSTGIIINAGDGITFSASGKIQFGSRSAAGPQGLKWCFRYEDYEYEDENDCHDDPYNYFPDTNHGALLYRIREPFDTESTWLDNDVFLGGAGGTFTAKKNGILEFNLNDKDPSQNQGSFYVNVEVCKSKGSSTNSSVALLTKPDIDQARKVAEGLLNLFAVELPKARGIDDWERMLTPAKTSVDSALLSNINPEIKRYMTAHLSEIRVFGYLMLHESGRINRRNSAETARLEQVVREESLLGASAFKRSTYIVRDMEKNHQNLMTMIDALEPTVSVNQTTTANQNKTTAKSRLPDVLADTYWIDSGGFTSLKLNRDGTAEMKSVSEKQVFTGSYSIGAMGFAVIKLDRAEIIGRVDGNKIDLFVKYLDGKVRKDSSGKSYTQENLSMEKYVEKSSSGNSQKDSSNKSPEAQKFEQSLNDYLNTQKNQSSTKPQANQAVDELKTYLASNAANRKKFQGALNYLSTFLKAAGEASDTKDLESRTKSINSALDFVFDSGSESSAKKPLFEYIQLINEYGYLSLDQRGKISSSDSLDIKKLNQVISKYKLETLTKEQRVGTLTLLIMLNKVAYAYMVENAEKKQN